MLRLTKEAYEIITGLVMLIIGFTLPLLMAIKVLPSSMELSLFSYAISLAGFSLGLHGIYGVISARRSRKAYKE